MTESFPASDLAEALEQARPAMLTLVGFAVAFGPAAELAVAQILNKPDDAFADLAFFRKAASE